MTYSPQSYLDVRALFRAKTGLPPEWLGIQHYSPEGGGYHEGNDLLAAAGRLDSDYSKRESERDRPGTNGASAIDIGWFDVTLPNGRRVTLIDLNRWLVAQLNAGTPDAAWIREVIYTLDRQTVKRWDRLGIRTSGDDSHLTHTHVSGHRDEENTSKVPLFQRFWDEMEGRSDVDAEQDRMLRNVDAITYYGAMLGQETVPGVLVGGVRADRPYELMRRLRAVDAKLDAMQAEWVGERARDTATTTALNVLARNIEAGGGDVNVAAIVSRINEVAQQATEREAAMLAELRAAHDEIGRLRLALAEAQRAGAAVLDTP